jgi:hypothetical protein
MYRIGRSVSQLNRLRGLNADMSPSSGPMRLTPDRRAENTMAVKCGVLGANWAHRVDADCVS